MSGRKIINSPMYYILSIIDHFKNTKLHYVYHKSMRMKKLRHFFLNNRNTIFGIITT